MKLYKPFLLAVICLLGMGTNAQTPQVDSLLRVLKVGKNEEKFFQLVC